MPRLRRDPYVAGYFYPGDREELLKLIETLFTSRRGPGTLEISKWKDKEIFGAILPHAGYIYSGEIAAHGYAAYNASRLKNNVVIIGPNHHGRGASVSIYPGGTWATPLGEVEVDDRLADRLAEADGYLALDEVGHIYEHSIEVHVPFLQYLYGLKTKPFKILPIAMLLQTYNAVEELGEALYNTLKEIGLENFFIIASTDFTHYESAAEAEKRDRYAIEAILNMDPYGLLDAVYQHDVTMCGYGPTATLLYLARKIGGFKISLLKYGNSGEVTGDYHSVVAYASFIIYRG